MNALWIGELNGVLLLFDESIQIPYCPYVCLWDVGEGEINKYVADGIRNQIKPSHNHEKNENCTNKYLSWRRDYGDDWLKKETSFYYEKLGINVSSFKHVSSKPTTRERHKEIIEQLGKEYIGVRRLNNTITDTRPRRTAQCYNCKQPLDNYTNMECMSCMWILCPCGACGCGYASS